MTTIYEATQAAQRSHPYYATALARLRLQADPNVPTMTTSKLWVTRYNPATLAGWTADEAGAVLVHELEHLLRRHSERCGDREHRRFNIAADAEINQRLAGLPDGVIYPETLGAPRGLTAETYYAIVPGQDDPGDDGESGAPGQPGAGQPGSGAPGQPGSGQPNCGSAAGGELQSHEAGDAANPGPGAADDGAAARKDAAERVMGLPPGTTAGDELRDWAEAELGIDRAAWYAALAGVIGQTLSSSGAPTRWRWPGRRDIDDMGGAMLPRWVSERPSCAVIIDTSSSITPSDLDMAVAAGHYFKRLADVRFYGCDTRPTEYGSALPERLYGGGGTDLRRGIDRALADGAKAVILITDCYTPWPDEDPGVPIIVGANRGAEPLLRNGPDHPQTGQWHPPEWVTILRVVTNPLD